MACTVGIITSSAVRRFTQGIKPRTCGKGKKGKKAVTQRKTSHIPENHLHFAEERCRIRDHSLIGRETIIVKYPKNMSKYQLSCDEAMFKSTLQNMLKHKPITLTLYNQSKPPKVQDLVDTHYYITNEVKPT